jgi:RNA polymerase sigma-70 factor (ECF subfamily)
MAPPSLVDVVDAVDPPVDELEPLVGRARGGDRRAMEELLRRSYDRVYQVCRRIVGNDSDAADAAQEALISVVRALPRFDGRSRYGTWLYRISVNAAIDEVRRRSRRRLIPFPGGGASGSPTGASAPGTSSDPVDVASPGHQPVFDGQGPEDVAARLDIEAALLALPLDFRAAVVLRDVCGLDYAEIAEVLAIPGGTVRSRIARGRSLLAGRLSPSTEEAT